MMWEAIIHGARGLLFWTLRVGVNDLWAAATQYQAPGVMDEIKAQNATITALASVLQTTINPIGLGATVSTPDLDVAWRNVLGTKYFIVLNTRAQGAYPDGAGVAVSGAEIHLTGVGAATTAEVYGEGRTVPIAAGTITDNFDAYQVHIYVVH